jgi:hypothetical protein
MTPHGVGKGTEEMHASHTASLIGGAALVLASAIASPAASAATRSAAPAYPAAQATPVAFDMPAAPGEGDVSQDTGAGQSASTVDFAPGETGTDRQDAPASDQGN